VNNNVHHIHRTYSSHGRTMVSFRYSYVPVTLDEPQLLMTNFSDFDGLCRKYGEENHWKGCSKLKNLKSEISLNSAEEKQEAAA
jgi:hypothetical protein